VTRTRSSSLWESVTNVSVGYILALTVWQVYFHMSGHDIPVSHNAGMGVLMIGMSFARLYVISRMFARRG